MLLSAVSSRRAICTPSFSRVIVSAATCAPGTQSSMTGIYDTQAIPHFAISCIFKYTLQQIRKTAHKPLCRLQVLQLKVLQLLA